MALVILFALVITPIVEIAVFMKVGAAVGVWSTLGLVLLTAVVGTWLLRQQGLSALWRMRQSLDRGEMPVDAAFDGVLLLFAGALLLTPGFVTDGAGLVLFIPAVRRGLQALARQHMVVGGRAAVWTAAGPGPGAPNPKPGAGPEGGNIIIEGEFTEVAEKKDQ